MKTILLLSIILLFACSNDDENCTEHKGIALTDENGSLLFDGYDGTIILCPIGKDECGMTITRACRKDTGECVEIDPCCECSVIGN